MSHRVILTETAKQDLREIAFYIAEQSKDKEIARQFVNELRKKMQPPWGIPAGGRASQRPCTSQLGIPLHFA